MARIFDNSWENGPLGCTDNALRDNGAWSEGGGFECAGGPDNGPATAVTDAIALHGSRCVVVYQRPGFENGTDWRVQRNHALITSGSLFYRWFKRWGANWHWGSSDHKMVILGNRALATQEIYFNTRRNFEDGPDPSRGRIVVHNTMVDAVWECNDVEAKLDPDRTVVIEAEVRLGPNGYVKVWVDGFECAFDTESAQDITNMPVGMNGFDYAKVDTTYNDGASITELMPEYVDGFAIDDAERIGGEVDGGDGDGGDGDGGDGDGDGGSGGGGSSVVARDLRPPLALALNVFGVPATVTVSGQDPVNTAVVWILPQMDRAPMGSPFGRLEPVRVAVVNKDAVPALPRGSIIEAPERRGGVVKAWEVDGPWDVDPTVHADEHRVLVLPRMAVTT